METKKRKLGRNWEGGAKRFALGNGVRKSRNFTVKPDTRDMVERLMSGEYLLLTGARQTGKTATVFFALEELQANGYSCVYVDFPAQCCSATSLREFWEIMSWCIYTAAEGLLPEPDGRGTFYEGILRTMLSQKGQQGEVEDVVLVFDEANHFSRLNSEFKDSFLSNLRFLKQNSGSRLLSLMMVGTDALLKDLTIANKYRKLMGMNVSGNIFSNDALFSSQDFTLEEVSSLLGEYSKFSRVEINNRIAAHIFELTRGRKGLVGVCCSLLAYDKSMVDFNNRSYSMWCRFARSSLIENVFSRPTYNSMYQNCYSLGDKDWILLQMLREGAAISVPLDDFHVVETIEFLVAEGIVVDTSSRGNQAVLEFSSPLLQSCLLKQLSLRNHLPVPCGPHPFDRIWVIERTIELLDFEVLHRPQSKNADGYTSEYGLQLEFFLKLKKVLSSAYPLLEWLVIPEAKCEENGRRRLDMLVRDGDVARWFAFEFLREGTLKSMTEHYERALWYAEAHSCQVYMVNFVLDGKLWPQIENFKGEEGGPVTVYNLVLSKDRARFVGGPVRIPARGDRDGGYEDKELTIRGARTDFSWERPAASSEARIAEGDIQGPLNTY